MDDRRDGPAGAFLGVERSVAGRRWVARPCDDRLALAISQRHDLPDLIARAIAARGVGLDDVPGFLDPRLRDALPDPGHLRDMAEAVERLARAVRTGETVGVFGDYDVDGATAAALVTRHLRALGVTVRHHIPDRLLEGYGPNAEAILGLRGAGASLVVTVDCGATAHAPLEAVRAAGLDVVVLDHHAGEERLPPAVAVVNPNRLDEATPHGNLAAVGVTFLTLVGLNRELRRSGWFTAGRTEPNLMAWLDLVALGTVCDVVPLTGVNRALVTAGLKVMAGRANLGLRALADVAGLREAPTAYHLGFLLGPRINAGGRVGEADLGLRLLTTADEREALGIAQRLDALNRDRQTLEAAVLDHCLTELEDPDAPLLLAAGEGWHPGVVGIVASRLRERFNRPACVVSLDGGMGTGSGRSVPGVDLGAMIIAARQAGVLARGGGHAMAAGFSVARDRLEDLRAFLSVRVAERIAAEDLRPLLKLDGALRIAAVTEDLIATVARIGPFGSGNAEPRFAIPRARVRWADRAGERHVRCMLADETDARLEAIAFRAMDGDLGPLLLSGGGPPLHVAGRARINEWGGRRTVQFQIDDAAPVSAAG